MLSKSLSDCERFLEFEIFLNVGAEYKGSLHVDAVKRLCGGWHADALCSPAVHSVIGRRLPLCSCTKALAVCAGEGPAFWPGFLGVGALPLG